MGAILNIIVIVILVIAGTGAYVYYNPDTAKNALSRITGKATQKIEDKTNEIIDDFKDKIPTDVLELIDKNPEQEQDFEQDIPFNNENTDAINKSSIEILGRPKKVVEFFCANDNHCTQYFQIKQARCELTSGICYISK